MDCAVGLPFIRRAVERQHLCSRRRLNRTPLATLKSDRMKPVDLAKLRAQFSGTRFCQLVQHHLRRERWESQDHWFGAILGTVAMLPEPARSLVEPFIDRWNISLYDEQFWQRDTASVLDEIIDDARSVLRPLGLAADDEAAFNLFNIVVLNYAYNAHNEPKIRRFMRIVYVSFPWSGAGGRYVGLPSRRLRKISRQLGKPIDLNKQGIQGFLSAGDRKASAEEALLDYCQQQPAIQSLLKEFKIARRDLQELYQQLILAYAGQWASGHWVAASALAYPVPLLYVLRRGTENIQETAVNLIMFFREGRPLGT